jgi:hypothetical protein
VRADGPGPIGIDKPGGCAGFFEGVVEEGGRGQEPALADENVVLESPGGGVVPGCRLPGSGMADRFLERRRDSWWDTRRTAAVGSGDLVSIEYWRVQVRFIYPRAGFPAMCSELGSSRNARIIYP